MNNNYNYNNNQSMNNMNYNQPNNMQQPINQGMNYNQTQPMNNNNVAPINSSKFPPIAKDPASIIGYIGAIMLIIGSFLNFATLKLAIYGEEILSEPINYFMIDGDIKDGVFVFLLGIVALLLIHLRLNLFSLIPTILATGVLILDVTNMSSLFNDYKSLYGNSYEITMNYGPAVFVIGIGLVLIIIHIILYFLNKNKNKSNNQSMNNMNYNQFNNMQQPMNQNMNYNQPQPMNQYPNNNNNMF